MLSLLILVHILSIYRVEYSITSIWARFIKYCDSLIGSFTDPKYIVDTSLGRYKAHDERVNPEKYNYRIEDTYNFNKHERDLPLHLFGKNEEGNSGMIEQMLNSPEVAGEYLANLFSTENRPVDIRLESKKSGGTIVERNPYNYTAKAI